MNNTEKRLAILVMMKTIPYTHPVTAAALAAYFELDTTAFRAHATALTRAGHPIGSDHRGFFWADSVEAKLVKLKHLLRRRNGLNKHIDAINDQLDAQLQVPKAEGVLI